MTPKNVIDRLRSLLGLGERRGLFGIKDRRVQACCMQARAEGRGQMLTECLVARQEAVTAEREACAKLVDGLRELCDCPDKFCGSYGCKNTMKDLARQIRARTTPWTKPPL